MRRILRLALVLTVLAVVIDWHPHIPPFPDIAQAQSQVPFTFGLNSQGLIQYSTASVSAVNTTSPVALWSSTVSGAYMATSANSNWPGSVATPAPLHLTLNGHITTNISTGGVGNINIGVNYGGGVTGVASVALVNATAFTQNLSTSPYTIDVWVSPVATATQNALPGGGACFFYLSARMTFVANGTTLFAANTCSAPTAGFIASAEQLNVIVQWASASLTNSMNVYQGVLQFGL